MHAGWNNRYDEWIKKDRIVSVTSDESLKKKSKVQTKGLNGTNQKKRERTKTEPATNAPVSNNESQGSQTQNRPPVERQLSSNRKSPVSANSRSRPTRSTSMEAPLHVGLLPKRRSRRSSGINESSDQQSHVSDSDEDEDIDESSMADSEPVAQDDVEAQTNTENQESKSLQRQENIATSEVEIENEDKRTSETAEPAEATSLPTQKTSAADPVPEDTPAAKPAALADLNVPKLTAEEDVNTEEKCEPQSDAVVLEKGAAKPATDPKREKVEELVKTVKDEERKSEDSLVTSKVVMASQESVNVVSVATEQLSDKQQKQVSPAEKQSSTTDASEQTRKKETLPNPETVEKKDKPVKVKKKDAAKEKKRRTSVDAKPVVAAVDSSVTKSTDIQIKEEPVEKKVVEQGADETVTPVVAPSAKESPDPPSKKDKKKDTVAVVAEKRDSASVTSDDVTKSKKLKTDKQEKQKNKAEKAAAAKVENLEVKNETQDKEESSQEKKVDGEKKKTKKKVKKKKEKVEEKDIKEKESKKVKDEYDFDDDSLCDVSEMRPLRTERDRMKEARKARETRKSESEKQPVVPDDNTPTENKALVLPASPKAPAIEPQDATKPLQLVTCLSDSVPVLERVQPVLPYMDPCRAGPSSAAVMENTPPDTPENSPPHALPPPELSPSHEGSSTKSETELPLEVDTVNNMDSNSASHSGGDSPNTCDTSIASSGSSGGSSGNAPGSESSGDAAPGATASTKRKHESADAPHSTTKRRKRSKKSLISNANGEKTRSRQHTAKIGASDSGEETVQPTDTFTSPSQSVVSSHASPSKRHSDTTATPGSVTPRSPRPSKYNFNLEEGKYLEGEKRIAFITTKIGEIRKIYMQLKAEVACIDRRRKRARRKEREGKCKREQPEATILPSEPVVS